jgi:Na+-translocating ferredoxin:NAD+ oxidoreductase RnfE subunit
MKELKKLIDLKSIITILITIALIIGWFKKMIPTEVFMPIVMMIYTFYFAKKDSSTDTEEKG